LPAAVQLTGSIQTQPREARLSTAVPTLDRAVELQMASSVVEYDVAWATDRA